MANTNPGGVDFNTSPYFDDYDDDKKFLRVLYVPGRAVQARELTQQQTLNQVQIQRFADYFFKKGAIVNGLEQKLDLSMNFVKLQSTFLGTEVDVEDFENEIVYGANSGIKALCTLVTDTEGTDPKTLYINYFNSGSIILTVNNAATTITSGNTLTLSTGNTAVIDASYIDPTTGANKLLVSSPNGAITTTTATTIDSTGTTIPLNITVVTDRRSADASNTSFNDDEIIFTANVSSRVYANTAETNATRTATGTDSNGNITYSRFGSKVTITEGIIYLSEHFVKHDTQTIILDKYTNTPTYSVGIVPNKTFVDFIEDATLLDNAQGTPNFQAPGADRFKIDTVLTKYGPTETISDEEFITILEIENGVSKVRKAVTSENKLDAILAQRTSEESGDYTISDPIVTVREHALVNNNNGRYAVADGGNTNLLLVEVDPFTAYVSGYRNQLISKEAVQIEKGLDTEFVEQVQTQVNYGQYVEVNELVGSWDFMEGTKVDLYDTPQQAITGGLYSTKSVSGNKIGEARIRAIEYVSGNQGTATAVYYLYIYEITMISGETFDKVRAIYDNATPKRYADLVLSSLGRAVVKEPAFNTLIFTLPYQAIKTIRDDNENVETSFTFKKRYSVTVSAGIATISSTDSSETFSGTGILNSAQKNESYMLIVNNSGANVETTALSGTMTVSASSNAISGTSTAFTTELNVGDVVNVNSELVRVASIIDDGDLIIEGVHTAGATANTFTKILPTGMPINLSGFGGTGSSRIVNVSSPGTVQIDIKEDATFTADVVTTMNRTNAREKRKTLNYQTQTNIDPNTHPNLFGGPYGLGYGDIYKLHAIYQSPDFSTPANTSSTNVTSSYTLDNGQRDYAYEHGTIIPNAGVSPTGRLLVVFDHFTHDTTQGLGYCSVDSYPVNDTVASNTTILTSEIPVFVSPTNKLPYNLRDSIDFRPIKTANTSLNPIDPETYQIPIGGLHIPKPLSDFDSDLIYYKGRISKVYINNEGVLGINDGVPAGFGSAIPVPPLKLPNTLELAEIRIPPYPSQPKNVTITLLKNKRFTMKDVSKLNTRVSKLEYFTALNFLEKEAVNKKEIDNDGFDKFKNGILVDPFVGHSVADTLNADWRSSIDKIGKYLTCYQENSNTASMIYDSGTSETTRTVSNKVFLPYTDELNPGLHQPYASRTLSLAEELTFVWQGRSTVVPYVDSWLDTVNDPEQAIVYNDTNADNWRALIDAWNTEVAPLTTHWLGGSEQRVQVGSTVISTTNGRGWRTGNTWNQEQIVTSQTRFATTQETYNQLASGSFSDAPAQVATGERVVNVEVAHWMRAREFAIQTTGLKNNSRVYAFFDNINVTEFCYQIVLLNGNTVESLSDLYDNDGILTGQGTEWDIVADGSTDEFYVTNNEIILLFTVPEKRFYVGQRRFVVTDSNTNGPATTYSECTIFAQGITQTKSEITINSRPFNVSFDDENSRISQGRRVNPDIAIVTATTTSRRVTSRPDPLSQSFYVDSKVYPYGFYVSSVDLFFQQKSSEDTRGVNIEIREMINGYPSKQLIGINDVARVLNPNINLSEDSSVATKFTFKSPVYLQPGNEYCFTVMPDDNDIDFRVYIAELGEFDITNPEISTRIETAFDAGILFSSADNRTWSARQNQDLKFSLYVAKFQTADKYAYWNNINVANNFTYDALTGIIADQSLSGAPVTYEIKTTDSSYNVDDAWTPINNFENILLDSRKQISNNSIETTEGFKSLQLRAKLSTINQYISPYVDDENIRFAFSKNEINNSLSTQLTGTVEFANATNYVVGTGTAFATEVTPGEYALFGEEYRKVLQVSNNTYLTVDSNFTTSNAIGQTATIRNEEHPTGPYSSESRYITRVVTLNDGFEATDLTVYLDINRPPGTTIKVYAKFLNESDDDIFDDKFYLPMTLEGTERYTVNPLEFFEEKYIIPVAAKTGGTQLLSGTIEISNTSTTVTGTSSAFIQELKIGDTIAVGTSRTEKTVTAIANNESMTVDSVFGAPSTTETYYRVLSDEVSYTTPDGRIFTGYKYFSVKVVFTSGNPNYSSKVKNLRAIALS